jgi:methylated-DNA-[protein]-cysteine S-methyltransferase
VDADIGTVATPLGPFTVIGTTDAVLGSGFTDSSERLLALVHPSLRPAHANGGGRCATHLRAVERYFDGELGALDDVPVAYEGGPFLRRAWVELRRVHAGQRISYAELARRSGSPEGSRAAGQACARNPATLFIPCHRIVRSDGHPNHFGWGLPLKRWLLAFEAPTE